MLRENILEEKKKMGPLLNSKLEVYLVTFFLIIIYLRLVDLHLKSQISLTSYWHWINRVFEDYLQWACNLSGQRAEPRGEIPFVVDEKLKESPYLLVFPQVNPDLLSPASLINLNWLSPVYHYVDYHYKSINEIFVSCSALWMQNIWWQLKILLYL